MNEFGWLILSTVSISCLIAFAYIIPSKWDSLNKKQKIIAGFAFLCMFICSLESLTIAPSSVSTTNTEMQAQNIHNVSAARHDNENVHPEATGHNEGDQQLANADPQADKKEATPELVKVDNYLKVTSPEDMKKDAIRDVKILFNALEKVTINNIKSDNIEKYIYSDSEANVPEIYIGVLVKALSHSDFRDSVRSHKQKEQDVPINRISNREVTERILKDIRYCAARINHNNSKWEFLSFKGNDIILKRKVLLLHSDGEVDTLIPEVTVSITGKYFSEVGHWEFDALRLLNDSASEVFQAAYPGLTIQAYNFTFLSPYAEYLDFDDLYKE